MSLVIRKALDLSAHLRRSSRRQMTKDNEQLIAHSSHEVRNAQCQSSSGYDMSRMHMGKTTVET
jgi:hypothetical protein